MKPANIIELIGYAFGGVVAASRGDYVTAAKCFYLAASSLVPVEVLAPFLTQSAVERDNMIVDVDEVVKFGALS